jgi:hypothetical protein
MAGLYPDEQSINLFGAEVSWPGLDPDTGKFTNGSFSDPLVRPSFMPAETINLLLDNIGNLLSYFGLTPNNTDPEQLKKAFHDRRPIGEVRFFGFEPTPLQLVMWRCLPLKGQIIEIPLYQDLCDLEYCGDDKNATAEWWYKCGDPDGLNRNINGAYMRVLNHQGIGVTGAGSQQRTVTWTDIYGVVHTATTTYDGGAIGNFQPDTMRRIWGQIGKIWQNIWTLPTNGGYAGAVTLGPATAAQGVPVATGGGSATIPGYDRFESSVVAPTGPYTKGPTISEWIGITY